ncbi:MAG: hypothetical protein WC806_03030 [Candidatus Gracilibacteria bacterium]|jgi:hypothetical protein
MAVFKYTVANKEGKQLNGVIEAADDATARNELNGLGFSILVLEESKIVEFKEDKTHVKFIFEALDSKSNTITGTIHAKDEKDAYVRLKKEYDLNVTAVYKESATEQEIEQARQFGTENLHNELIKEEEAEHNKDRLKSIDDEKKDAHVRTTIEHILKQVYELLKKLDKDLSIYQKTEINKRVNKILRIKNSSNLEYLKTTTDELLQFLKDQEDEFKQKGLKITQLTLQMKTRELLSELKTDKYKKGFKNSILEKITDWQKKHDSDKNFFYKIQRKFILRIRNFFTTPIEILKIQEEIKAYNRQLWEFAMMYLQEPTKDYRKRVRASIITVWGMRKKAKQELKKAKAQAKHIQAQKYALEGEIFYPLIQEINTFSGYLLFFYLIYYFVSIYLSTKNFGIQEIPHGFLFYESKFFKYILSATFSIHAYTALKTNFFNKNLIYDAIAIPAVAFAITISILNF